MDHGLGDLNPTGDAPAAANFTHNGNGASDDDRYDPNRPDPLPSRAQVRAIRDLEVRGVPFKLRRTGGTATVRAHSMADEVILAGLPNTLQQQWVSAINSQNRMRDVKTRTTQDQIRLAGSDNAMANVACVAGFIKPRLVLHEHELDGSDDCWLVTDLHTDERRAYLAFVTGNPTEEDLKMVAAFRDASLSGAATL